MISKPAGITLAEVGRKLYHLLGLLIPIIYLYSDVSRELALVITGTLWLVAVVFDIIRLNNPGFNELALRFSFGIIRPGERDRLNGMVFYMLAVFLVILFWDKSLASLSLIILVVGDTFAALIGLAWGYHKIFGGVKSWEGFAACFISVFLVSLAFLPPQHCLVAAAVTAIIEALPTLPLVNDNLLIPVVSSTAIWASNLIW